MPKTIIANGKTYRLPDPMNFEGLGQCFWEGGEWRCPNKGDYFVSGAIPEGYLTKQHLSREYIVVKPTHYAKQVPSFVKAEPVQFTQGGVPLPRHIAYRNQLVDKMEKE